MTGSHQPGPVLNGGEDLEVNKRSRDTNSPNTTTEEPSEEGHAKKPRIDSVTDTGDIATERVKGVATVKQEFLIEFPSTHNQKNISPAANDDAAEAVNHLANDTGDTNTRKERKKSKSKGQATNRSFGSSRDNLQLCPSRILSPELSPESCRFGDRCRFEHNLRTYLEKGKRADLSTFDGTCPVWQDTGKCPAGWKCRFVSSHMTERAHADGTTELILIEAEGRPQHLPETGENKSEVDIFNTVTTAQKTELMKRKYQTPKADEYNAWLDVNTKELEKLFHTKKVDAAREDTTRESDSDSNHEVSSAKKDLREDARASYTEAPFLPSEKRRIYFGPETPVLAPLTTQGNLPFRRLCIDLGAQITYSEMAVSLPLIQGSKSEWALLKAHRSETTPPAYSGGSVVSTYDQAKDLKFGVQISASKVWQALKATEAITNLCPKVRVVDLNCGCPIDLIFRSGAGSALLDSPGKLEKMIRGMNAVSGEVPVTVKIRMGTKDSKPTALKLSERLAFGGREAIEVGNGASGAAAITLHGRSRQQRYTKSADWQYISECAALIRRFNEDRDTVTDTVKEVDPRQGPSATGGKVYFIGNGDCYSHVDYNTHLEEGNVDSVMVARGALIKPWIFEEIEKGQYLDKSATERLEYIERFARYGLQTWGSDEVGLGTTRKFLLEWLSFAHRYVPVGILEHLPPNIQDRPPAWKGRNELESLLGSDDHRDWIKISEMFLGPAAPGFHYEPKRRTNDSETQAEG
ncbi:MAG: hypothetical protein M1825_000519 [Sarcosagium campestre]|nr:MAG: hypothetical protein M1825_000519 [Sarcosagium campestre]